MMVYTVSGDSDPNVILNVIQRYLGGELSVTKRDGESTMAFKRREIAIESRHDAYSEALECLIAAARANYFNKWESVPMVPAYEVRVQLLPALRSLWRDKKYQNMNTHERDVFWEGIQEEVARYIITPQLLEDEAKRHRAAVLKGSEEAVEADKEWLTQEAEELRAKAAKLEAGLKDL
jgi:hypothetical protein